VLPICCSIPLISMCVVGMCIEDCCIFQCYLCLSLLVLQRGCRRHRYQVEEKTTAPPHRLHSQHLHHPEGIVKEVMVMENWRPSLPCISILVSCSLTCGRVNDIVGHITCPVCALKSHILQTRLTGHTTCETCALEVTNRLVVRFFVKKNHHALSM
jgi:hypothetical protein